MICPAVLLLQWESEGEEWQDRCVCVYRYLMFKFNYYYQIGIFLITFLEVYNSTVHKI